jgi:hypothetical protein
MSVPKAVASAHKELASVDGRIDHVRRRLLGWAGAACVFCGPVGRNEPVRTLDAAHAKV